MLEITSENGFSDVRQCRRNREQQIDHSIGALSSFLSLQQSLIDRNEERMRCWLNTMQEQIDVDREI